MRRWGVVFLISLAIIAAVGALVYGISKAFESKRDKPREPSTSGDGDAERSLQMYRTSGGFF